MIYTVILILTLMNGDTIQKTGVEANSFNECVQIIDSWQKEMLDWKQYGGSKPSTFITGCSKRK